MREKLAYEVLERRVEELEKEAARQKRFEEINRVLFRIANAVNTTSDLDELYASIHRSLSPVIDTTNFYIALYDPSRDSVTFPYCIDTVDECYPSVIEIGKTESLTAEVIRTGRPLMITKEEMLRRRAETSHEIPACTPSEIWLGVPLNARDSIVGVMTVQSYTDAGLYDRTDLEVLVAVADQVAVAIERKRAEEALRKSEEKYRSLVDSMTDWVWSMDLHGVHTFSNGAVEQLLGYGPREILHRSSYPLMHPDSEAVARKVTRECAEARTGWTGLEVAWLHKDGSVRYFESTARPVFDEEGNLAGFSGVDRDITQRKRAEAEKAAMEEHHRQSRKVEAIGRLAGGVAHDLNNLLSPILGYAEMLVNDLAPGDERRGFAEEIVQASFRARELVRQLLAFGRKQTLKYRPMDVNRTVQGLQTLLRRTIREDIEIVTALEPAVPSVEADVGQIEQVIINLSVNAQDAMPQGGRLILETGAVRVEEGDEAARRGVGPGECVLLTVRDTGSGMDEETLERIFEPFFSTKGVLGTGLGLATVYGIVKQHGGDIVVESEAGKGATFKIYLPASGEAEVAEAFEEPRAGILSGPETILLVEDSRQVRKMACEMLRQLGYRVIECESGSEALEALSKNDGSVHLLLTDVVMPEMNGKELYLRAVEAHPSLKVLYMSGYNDEVVARRGVPEDDVCFIAKPFTVQALAAKVREVLG